jgi:hypothetical protein
MGEGWSGAGRTVNASAREPTWPISGLAVLAQAAVFVDFDTIVLIAKLLHPALCRPIDPAVGVWLSLVEHYVRDVGVVGSNPITPTNFPGFAMD